MESSTCPFIGLKTDPNTPLSFASQGNYCHRARPIAPIDRDHQRNYCLTNDYQTCPVFVRIDVAPLPPGIYSSEHWQRIIIGTIKVLSIAVLLIYSGVMTNVWWSNSGSLLYYTLLRGSNTQDAGDTTSKPNLPTQTPFLGLGSTTPNVTVSDEFSLPAQETPISPTRSCKPPEGWVSYTIQPTDSLFRLSLIFGISVDDIRSANCFQDDELVHSGQVVYIPPTPTTTLSPTPTLTLTPPRQPLPTLTYTSKPKSKPSNPTSRPLPTSTPKPTSEPPTPEPPTPEPPTPEPPTPEPPTPEPTPTLASFIY